MLWYFPMIPEVRQIVTYLTLVNKHLLYYIAVRLGFCVSLRFFVWTVKVSFCVFIVHFIFFCILHCMSV